ncbi:vesicular glutamate transporter 2-like [Dendronephthya gigantea]|uniref:vesicular glutamate transporter 2-like n=1 Tax=Dendronephthya gigantea TaxID=151771 RepID=UPI00106C9873|nr:vesicular glutamate transporter 2-like [Dendronephthya gigantea]
MDSNLEDTKSGTKKRDISEEDNEIATKNEGEELNRQENIEKQVGEGSSELLAKQDEEARKDSRIAESSKFSLSYGIPKRYVLLLLVFLGFVNIYGLRINLNVALVAMVNNRTYTRGGVTVSEPAEFHWNSKTQGIVLGSFFYGYWALQVPGAWIAMKLGGTRVFGYGVLLSALLTLLTPVAARYSVGALIGLRVFEGLFLGVSYPCNHAIWSKWAPVSERSTLVTAAIAGAAVGNIVALPLTGLLCKYGFDGGWPTVFYFFGSMSILWYLIWEFFAYESPAVHPTISESEKDYIEGSIADEKIESDCPPWGKILTSPPVWGINIGHFGACWGYYTLFTEMPTFLKDILHFDIKHMGFLAACPYMLKSVLGPLGGLSADFLIKYKIMSIRNVRALCYAIGCIFAGIFIVATSYATQRYLCVIFLVLGVGFSGINAAGYAVNHLDIAPRYAGLLMGLSNTFGSMPGFLSPMLTGYIAHSKDPEEWKIVFWITLIIYVVTSIIYAILVSGTKQPWADKKS